jgi:hypothetical protein
MWITGLISSPRPFAASPFDRASHNPEPLRKPRSSYSLSSFADLKETAGVARKTEKWICIRITLHQAEAKPERLESRSIEYKLSGWTRYLQQEGQFSWRTYIRLVGLLSAFSDHQGGSETRSNTSRSLLRNHKHDAAPRESP